MVMVMVTHRPKIVGPMIPMAPYPIRVKGEVVHGYQRGSKQLGIPTANFPEHVSETIAEQVSSKSGIYFGWASVNVKKEEDLMNNVYPMVMSLGWNPFFKNQKRSAEVHIIHEFEDDFYGEELRVIILGYIREEKNYSTLDALIEDIHVDIQVALSSLQRPAYESSQHDPFLKPSCSLPTTTTTTLPPSNSSSQGGLRLDGDPPPFQNRPANDALVDRKKNT
ncbi:riboflavin kinase [Coelomomyces lativittatus]|nr:riboflavin kinase [Coelomomyces lativittatus]